MMRVRQSIHVLILLCLYNLSTISLASSLQDRKVLKVGQDLWKQMLPLRSGSILYELHGLEPYKWYEVKISYPASIPASFTLQLGNHDSDFFQHQQRKLLNTEKLIFQNNNPNIDEVMYVLVSVMPEGVVAIPNAKEQDFIIYNIVCDELLLGIPIKAWMVGALVMICLATALIVPRYLQPFLMRSNVAATEQQASKKS